MKKAHVIILWKVIVEMDVNENRLSNENYINEVKDELFKKAEHVLQTNSIKPYVHAANIEELID